jgi:glyoxylase-like metal-dependent hydrolase (beta-lactamase superfamily II)
MRELAKRLPIDEPWPSPGPEMRKAVERFGLDRNTPPDNIPMPARIVTGFYLVGQDIGGNLTYLVDCGPEGVAIIDPTFESEFEKTLARVEQCGFSRKKIQWVINTHCHMDHAMADSKFRQMGAKIMIHEADAEAVEKGTRVTAYYFVPPRSARWRFASSPRCWRYKLANRSRRRAPSSRRRTRRGGANDRDPLSSRAREDL